MRLEALLQLIRHCVQSLPYNELLGSRLRSMQIWIQSSKRLTYNIKYSSKRSKMPTWHPQFLFGRVLALAVCIGFTVAEKLDKFDQCKIRVNGILDDNETFGDINNETIASYIYDGPVRGMNAEFARTSRDSFITLTTEGVFLSASKFYGIIFPPNH